MIDWIKDNRGGVIIAAILFAGYVVMGLLTGEWDAWLGNWDPLV